MNIFYLAHNPTDCAQMHCDKHVVKMILETAQLLSTAHHERGSTAPYKSTHRNHPSAVWVRSGVKQYQWAYSALRGSLRRIHQKIWQGTQNMGTLLRSALRASYGH